MNNIGARVLPYSRADLEHGRVEDDYNSLLREYVHDVYHHSGYTASPSQLMNTCPGFKI